MHFKIILIRIYLTQYTIFDKKMILKKHSFWVISCIIAGSIICMMQ